MKPMASSTSAWSSFAYASIYPLWTARQTSPRGRMIVMTLEISGA